MDPMFTNLWKRDAEQTSGLYPAAEQWNPDESPGEGLRRAQAGLHPALRGPGLHDRVGGGRVVRGAVPTPMLLRFPLIFLLLAYIRSCLIMFRVSLHGSFSTIYWFFW